MRMNDIVTDNDRHTEDVLRKIHSLESLHWFSHDATYEKRHNCVQGFIGH